MFKRRLIRWGLGVALVLLVMSTWRLTGPWYRINQESLDGIQEGMTAKDVEVIIGVAPGDYRTVDNGALVPMGIGPNLAAEGYRVMSWEADEGLLSLVLDPEGKVAWKEFRPSRADTSTILARLRVWLDW